MKFIAIGGIALLLLAVANALLPKFFYFLPLGGSTIAEMGIVFGLAIAAQTVEALRQPKDD